MGDADDGADGEGSTDGVADEAVAVNPAWQDRVLTSPRLAAPRRAGARKNPMLNFLNLLCVMVVDQADKRTSVAQLVADVLRDAGGASGLRHMFGAVAAVLCEHPKGAVRQPAVALASLLLHAGKREDEADCSMRYEAGVRIALT